MDYFIVLVVLLHALISEKGKWCLSDFSILCGFASLATFIGIALYFQYFTYNSVGLAYIFNFMGFLRPTLYYLAASYLIKDHIKAAKVLNYICNLCIIVSLSIIIEYFDVLILEDAINIIYRGDVNTDVGNRAIGLFQRVHGAAYFNLFSLIFIIAILQIKKELHLKKNKVLVGLLLIAMVLSFSKSTFIVLIFYFLIAYKWKLFMNIKVIKVLIGSVIVLAFTIYLNDTLYQHMNALFLGFLYLAGMLKDTSANEIGFITGRVNHGWKNALDVWSESIWFGNINHGYFVGDGGYTETLANHGLLGLAGYLIMFIFFLRSDLFYARYKSANRFTITNITLCLMIALIPVGILMERISELIPFYFVILSRILRFTNTYEIK